MATSKWSRCLMCPANVKEKILGYGNLLGGSHSGNNLGIVMPESYSIVPTMVMPARGGGGGGLAADLPQPDPSSVVVGGGGAPYNPRRLDKLGWQMRMPATFSTHSVALALLASSTPCRGMLGLSIANLICIRVIWSRF